MKNHLLFLASMLMVFGSIFAQEPVKYQRSSLHMVLLTTDEPITDDPELIPLIEQAYQNYPFPDKYNNHEIDFKTANAGKPKGGLIATMNQLWDYNTHTSKLPSTPKELKALKEALGGGGKKYLEQLKTNIDVQIKQNDVARKLVMKWYNIQPDGSNDANLLVERSAFNMNSSDVQTAAATAGGAQEIVNQVAEELINTTFVVFSKIDFYKNEATAGVTRDITIAGALPGIAFDKMKAAFGEPIDRGDNVFSFDRNGTTPSRLFSISATRMTARLIWTNSMPSTSNSSSSAPTTASQAPNLPAAKAKTSLSTPPSSATSTSSS